MPSRSLVWRYYAYRVTGASGFYLPVSIVYLTDQGFGLGFVGLVHAAFSFAMLAAEIPTGYVGDRLGRRGSLAVGNAVRAGGMVGYVLVDEPLGYLAVYVLWAFGWAFRSGTQDAWLYELLRSCCDEDQFARVDGRGSTALLAVSAAGALVSGLLYAVGPWVPFAVNAAVAFAGIPILYTFPAVATGDDDVFTVREALRALRLQAGRPAVRWLVVYAALFHGLFSVTRWLEQPALRSVGVSVAGLGVVYAAFKLVSATVASTTGWFQETLGTRGVFALLIPVYGLAFAAVAVFPLAVVPLLFLNRGVRIVTRPVRNQYLNDRLDDVGRATVLSGASMVLSLASGTANLVGGQVADGVGPLAFLPWAGVAVAVAGVGLWVTTRPVRGEAGPFALDVDDGAAASD